MDEIVRAVDALISHNCPEQPPLGPAPAPLPTGPTAALGQAFAPGLGRAVVVPCLAWPDRPRVTAVTWLPVDPVTSSVCCVWMLCGTVPRWWGLPACAGVCPPSGSCTAPAAPWQPCRLKISKYHQQDWSPCRSQKGRVEKTALYLKPAREPESVFCLSS